MVHDCMIVPRQGRCQKADDCRHYWDCLDTAAAKNWPGWRRLGESA
jgi:hypothetical protein